MKKEYFIALTGAKKNLGDFLITERALRLLNYVAPEYDYILMPHWEKFSDLSYVNNSKGIIILGGPGFQENMFPGVYKLTDNLDDITVPIYTLGAGWKGFPGDKVTEKLYNFTSSARKLLKKMNTTTAGMSCRDYQTLRVVNRAGYRNITMTGCPVWYDIPSIGIKDVKKQNSNKIVFTPAQELRFSDQSKNIMNLLKNKFADKEVIVSFHRGVGAVDDFTKVEDANNTQKLSDYALSLGFKVEDVSFDLEKINFYDNCDLHIGYRVHAHIYFLSKRLPSILLHEDGRGNGVTESLQSNGLNAYKISRLYSFLFSLVYKGSLLKKIYKKFATKNNEKLIDELEGLLNNLEVNCFSSINKSFEIIDSTFPVMINYLKKVIYGK